METLLRILFVAVLKIFLGWSGGRMSNKRGKRGLENWEFVNIKHNTSQS